MSAIPNPNARSPVSTEPLQFERADFQHGAAFPCSFCKAPIAGQYFQVNGQTACPNCRDQIDSAMSGGSKPLRAFRALAAGAAAAIGGFLIYWGVRALTGYEFGLIAILIGFMVGGAVRWGAQIRGGLFYQLMAVVLTYLSIASNYTPDVIQGMRQPLAEEAAAEVTTDTTPAVASPSTENSVPADISPASEPTSTTAPAESQIPLWFAIPVAFIISLAVPFMGGLNIIGWLIIAFGLMQAWSMNKRVPIQVSGPFDTGSAPPPSPVLQT
jgi:hypothetical protein